MICLFLNIGYFDDAVFAKTGQVRDDAMLIWPALLSLAKNNRGNVTEVTVTSWLLFRLHLSWTDEHMREVLKFLADGGMIETDFINGYRIPVEKWRKYQKDPTHATRQAEYREREKVKCHVTEVTVSDGSDKNDGDWKGLEGIGKDQDQTPPPPPKTGGFEPVGFSSQEPDKSPMSEEWRRAAKKAQVDEKWARFIWRRTPGIRKKLVNGRCPEDSEVLVLALANLLDKQDQAKVGFGERVQNPEKWCMALIQNGDLKLPPRPDGLSWPGRQATVAEWEYHLESGYREVGIDYDLGPPDSDNPKASNAATP